MKRMFIFTVAISFFLVAFSAGAAVPDIVAPNGKSFYSSRPPRAKTITEGTPALAPQYSGAEAFQPTIPTPHIVRDESISVVSAPMPAPQIQSGKMKPQPSLDFSDMTFDQLGPPQNSHSSRQLTSRPVSSSQRPLSSITVEKPVETKKPAISAFTQQPLDVPQQTTTAPSTSKPVQPDVRETKVDEIDSFNARLATIQLEKHNFAETLRLIEKIKSPQFKVKTLVDLTEYVSRDNNYKREADQLYALSLDGVEALVKGDTFVVKAKDELKFEPVPSSPEKTQAPVRKSLTLIEEDTPIAKPTPTTPVTPKESISTLTQASKETEVQPAPAPKKPVLAPLDEEPVKPSSVPAPAEKKPVISLLDDEPVKKETVSDKIDINKDVPTTVPSLALPTPKPTLLEESPENVAENLEEKTETKTPSGKRPSILLGDLSVDDNETKMQNTVKDSVKAGPVPLPSTVESPSKAEIKPFESKSSPTKRPMPGKKSVALEEN